LSKQQGTVKYSTFLKDVARLSITAFGGPQVHIALFLNLFVTKRNYISEKELIELNALCNILPGPTSTQTITAIGFRLGGPNLAYLTLLIWMLPAVTIMTMAGILVSLNQSKSISFEWTRFIQPMAVGFVGYAALTISRKVITSRTAFVIMVLAGVASYFFRNPFSFPILILLGGAFTAFKYKRQPLEEKAPIKIQWANFLLWAGVFVLAASLGAVTQYRTVLLFENFYRNGSLIFGGGQVLIPYLYTEFVDFKDYLSSEEFLSGFAMVQALPGPVFSFSAYIGVLSSREFGVVGEIAGALVAAIGIFLPGTFLIFFVIRFWESVKRFRIIRASLEGISAASAGMVAAAAVLLFIPLEHSMLNLLIVLGTFSLLTWTKIPAPVIIITGIVLGLVL